MDSLTAACNVGWSFGIAAALPGSWIGKFASITVKLGFSAAYAPATSSSNNTPSTNPESKAEMESVVVRITCTSELG